MDSGARSPDAEIAVGRSMRIDRMIKYSRVTDLIDTQVSFGAIIRGSRSEVTIEILLQV
jgi:hypothetical protein